MNKTDFLRDVPIFSELQDNTLEKIYNSGYIKSYKKGDTILSESESGTSMFFIVEGKVKVIRSDEDKEIIISLLGPGEFFGEMSILDGMGRSATVTAVEDSKLFILQRHEFLDLLYSYPEVSVSLLRELSIRLRNATNKIKALSLKDAEGKVATVLLQIADDIGRIKQGVVEIDNLPYQQELANMAGTSRETISRTLHSFAKKGLIEIEGSKIRILNYEQFRELYGK
ncbi:MAG: Crp/Fnr family transcriptional regulator [Ignavibacterium sp.]|nr:Crp/Fnr family transcriptional regulator [Ignavibacterium sp.]MCX7612590.1 Crp/Fnr family transcriptional regulator [Ignavibacterium sp.]MDW8374230.1 Crp/Fnr family transcriptional regulator [Ignavibacteriales bacterium]